MSDVLPALRDEFLVPGPGPYVLTHSVGCLPRSAAARLESHFLAPWREHGGDAWGGWLGEVDGFRAALAGLLGGAPAQYCPQANLSSGLSKLLGALPPPRGERRTWLVAEDAFPSLGFVLRQGRRLGYELRMLPRGAAAADPETWRAAIDARTYGVLATHVHSNTGLVTPVAAIAEACRDQGALCVVDVAQSAGVLPLRVEDLGAQVVLGSCIKWLCGGPGAAFAWIEPSLLARLDPVDVGWFSHAAPFEFDIRHWRPAADARRLWGGTPSVAPFVLAAESLRRIAAIGVERILAHNRTLLGRFVECLPARWRARVATQGIGGTLCLPLGADFDVVRHALTGLGARFDTRGEVLRLSFHACNDLGDAERLAGAWGAGGAAADEPDRAAREDPPR
jgi:selenocysteine lyase/cysteine desulfurase